VKHDIVRSSFEAYATCILVFDLFLCIVLCLSVCLSVFQSVSKMKVFITKYKKKYYYTHYFRHAVDNFHTSDYDVFDYDYVSAYFEAKSGNKQEYA